MKHYIWTGLVFMAAASTANAGCAPGQHEFTSCQIDGRNTEVFVCYGSRDVTYSYGPVGELPDLILSETVENIDFVPWSGIGKAIGEGVTFYNGRYSYEVVGGFDRPFSDDEEAEHFGWLEVAQDGKTLSRLECVPETVTYSYGEGIYQLKVAAGLMWDNDTDQWLWNPQHFQLSAEQTDAPLLMTDPYFDNQNDCLPHSEFELGGIEWGMPIASLAALGIPVTRGDIIGDLAGAEWSLQDGLGIIIHREIVKEISSAEPQWSTPSGLRVGLTREEVLSIFGRVPQRDIEATQPYQVAVCVADKNPLDDWPALVIAFGPDQRVQKLSIEIDWP